MDPWTGIRLEGRRVVLEPLPRSTRTASGRRRGTRRRGGGCRSASRPRETRSGAFSTTRSPQLPPEPRSRSRRSSTSASSARPATWRSRRSSGASRSAGRGSIPPCGDRASTSRRSCSSSEDAFGRLGCRRVELKTDALNERSRAALAALPAQFEGVFRKHMLVRGGENRDSAWYAIVDDDWPEVRANLDRRLEATKSTVCYLSASPFAKSSAPLGRAGSQRAPSRGTRIPTVTKRPPPRTGRGRSARPQGARAGLRGARP